MVSLRAVDVFSGRSRGILWEVDGLLVLLPVPVLLSTSAAASYREERQ